MKYRKYILSIAVITIVLAVGSQPINAQPIPDKLLQRLDSLQHQSVVDTSLVQTYANLSRFYLRVDSAKTAYYAHRSLEVADSIDSRLGVGIGHMAIGLYNGIQGRYSQGLRHSFTAETIFENLHRPDYLAMLYSYIGMFYHGMANYNEALAYYLKSDSLMEMTGTPMEQAQIHANIGIIYSGQDHHRASIPFFKKALKVIKKQGSDAQLGILYNNLGVSYRQLGRLDTALSYQMSALELRKKADDRWGQASSYYNLGTLYYELGQYDNALKNHLKAIKIREELGQQGELTKSYLQTGKVYNKLGLLDKAGRFAYKSLEIAKRINDLKTHAHSLLLLSNLNEKQGDFKNALSFRKSYQQLQDSLTARNKSKEFEKMRARYESEKMEQQIKLLKKDQQLQEARLKRADVTRNSLIGGTIGLLLILGLLFLRYRSGKKNEQILQAKNKQLEEANQRIQNNDKIIRQQSSKLQEANDDLNMQNKQLERLNEEKNEYLRIAAHDLKNPLGSITGLAELIKDPESTIEEAREHAEFIYISTFRMLELIDLLLDVNAIESGKKLADNRPVRLNTEVRDIIEQHRYRAEWKDISISLEEEDEELVAHADPGAFREILENLVSNAIKYSPEGTQIKIRAYHSNSSIRFEVEDEGPGLSRQEQKHLFKKFKRLSPEPTGGEHSTGLGLYIVKRMADAMNGRVWCESTLGEGCTFVLELEEAQLEKA